MIEDTITLTREQLVQIVEEATEKALLRVEPQIARAAADIVVENIYAEIGRVAVKRALSWIGVGVVVLLATLAALGKIKT